MTGRMFMIVSEIVDCTQMLAARRKVDTVGTVDYARKLHSNMKVRLVVGAIAHGAMIKIKRIYAGWDAADGYRVLVDRLWPRGVSKEAARCDEWLREIAPGNELRKWYDHQPERWAEFVERFRQELATPAATAHLKRLRLKAREETVTLVFSSRRGTPQQCGGAAAYHVGQLGRLDWALTGWSKRGHLSLAGMTAVP